MIYVATTRFGIFPVMSGTETKDAWALFIVPVVVLGLGNGTVSEVTRHLRTHLEGVLAEDYIRTARAKGARLWRHLYKDGFLMPLSSLMASKIPYMLGGAIIVEQVFNWPGMGRLAWQAALDRDYPILLGVTLVSAVIVRLAHVVKGATQVAVNPPARGVSMSTTYVELNREAPSGNVPNAWSRVRSYSKGRPLAATYGIAVVVTITAAYLCSLVGILPADPDAMDLSAMNQSPSLEHLLGTDFVGRDLLTRIMVGTQAFFLPGLLAVAVSLVLGSFFGVLAGFWPERFETPVGLFLQLLESLPKLVLVLLVIALYRPNIYLVLIVVGITNVPATAELLRAKIASLRSKSYIEAALALGLHPRRVILKHLLWLHGRGILLVQASLAMGEAILIETSLSYLGFGVQEPTPSWGNMIALGKDYFFRGELWVSTAPALPILFTILGFYLLGDSLRETE